MIRRGPRAPGNGVTIEGEFRIDDGVSPCVMGVESVGEEVETDALGVLDDTLSHGDLAYPAPTRETQAKYGIHAAHRRKACPSIATVGERRRAHRVSGTRPWRSEAPCSLSRAKGSSPRPPRR